MKKNKKPKAIVFMHSGAFGESPNDFPIDAAMRMIANAASKDPDGEWSDKYGTEYDNEIFRMNPFCWCEKEECAYCWDFSEAKPPQTLKNMYGMEDERSAPNFWYKPTNFKLWWYKYIGRGVETSEPLNFNEIVEMTQNCLKSITK